MIHMKTGQIPNHKKGIKCPNCAKDVDGFTSLENATPSAGDVTICLYCSATLEFVDILGQLDVKPASDEALGHVDPDELQRIKALVGLMTKDKAIFVENTTYRCRNGVHSYDCIKDLWGTSSTNKEEAEREALSYFWQYYEDGEYDR